MTIKKKGDYLKLFQDMLKKDKNKSLKKTIKDTIDDNLTEFNEQSNKEIIKLIINITKMTNINVSEIMIPRADIVGIDSELKISDAMNFVSTKPFSRYPIYDGNLDDVSGMINIKDVFFKDLKKTKRSKVKDIKRPIMIIAPSLSALDLLLKMQVEKIHVAMVVDEFGGIDGMLTMENLIEQIVGEIEDEFDVEENPEILLEKNTAIVNARYSIENFEEKYGKILSEEEMKADDIDTLGGLIYKNLGRMPLKGEFIKHTNTGMNFEILEVDSRKIIRIKIHNLPDTIKKH